MDNGTWGQQGQEETSLEGSSSALQRWCDNHIGDIWPLTQGHIYKLSISKEGWIIMTKRIIHTAIINVLLLFYKWSKVESATTIIQEQKKDTLWILTTLHTL